MAGNPGRAALDVYFADLRRHPLLSPDDERELARAARNGDTRARDRLITSNLRFVVSVAKRYQGLGLPLEDLVCEGNEGVVRAAETFDPERGVRFITYAVSWIRVKIDRALARAPTVRRPLTHEREARRVRRLAASLASQLGSRASPHEIAHVLSMDPDAAAAALKGLCSPSLDGTGSNGDRSPLDQLPAAEPLPDEDAVEAERQRLVAAVLETLPEREATVLRLMYGLDGAPLTQREIAVRFGLTRQRIQQIASDALKRLREPARAGRLHGLLDADAASARPRARERDPTRTAPRTPRQRTISPEVAALRVFFRLEVERTSLRATAGAAALKRSGLAKFVDGRTAQPHPQSLELMRAFHARRQAEQEHDAAAAAPAHQPD